MSILGTIMEKLLPSYAKANSAGASSNPNPAQVQSIPSPLQVPPIAASPSAGPNVSAAPQSVDIEEVLNEMESRTSQHLNWRNSIVDLMKMLDMDSDLASRKQLAKELNYTGDTNDTATMNVWLHKQVMRKLEENGGKIPESMKH